VPAAQTQQIFLVGAMRDPMPVIVDRFAHLRRRPRYASRRLDFAARVAFVAQLRHVSINVGLEEAHA